MSGLCGFAKTGCSADFLDASILTAMSDAMILRGSDGNGVWLEESNLAGIAHRRLSSSAFSSEQPMPYKSGSMVVSFDGEIYNRSEICKELAQSGGDGKILQSDAEVILRAYEQWGIDCLSRFRGIFAIALWDGRERKLWLVRDRIGVKTLYYTISNGLLLFASEVKAILKALPNKPDIGQRALYDYLTFFTTPCEDTLFKDIKKIRPGSWICLEENGKMTSRQYWDLWEHTLPDVYGASEDEIKIRLMDELRTVMRYCRNQGAPTGVFLSGGIDSSVLAALLAEGGTADAEAFCIGYDKDYAHYKSETPYASLAAKHVGISYRERLLTQSDIFDFLPEMIRLQDEPIADPTCVPSYYVAKLALDSGVSVCQVGEGSDELFWGYESWRIFLQLQKANGWPIHKMLKKAGLGALRAAGRSSERYYEFLRRATEDLPIFWSGAEAFFEEEKRKMLSPELLSGIGGYTTFEAIRPTYERFQAAAWEKSPLNWMIYSDLRHRVPELLLLRSDKMSVGAGVTCRVPFLDHKFVELAMSIPQSMKTKGGVSKYLLKSAVRGMIPDEIIDRKKQGFTLPVRDLFLERLGAEMRREVGVFARESGLLNSGYITQLLDNPSKGREMWYLFSLALWWKQYIR